jgi:hypothetical protein
LEKFEPLFEEKQSGRTVAVLVYSATLKQTGGGDLMDGMKKYSDRLSRND